MLRPPPATPDEPHDNLHAIQAKRVRATGKKSNGDKTTGVDPRAWCSATVSAGEIPEAHANVGHDDPNQVKIGIIDDYVEWEGEASATLTRAYWYEAMHKVEQEPNKTHWQETYLSVEKRASHWKSTTTGLAAGAAASAACEAKYGKGNLTGIWGRGTLYVTITLGLGTIMSFKKEVYNAEDMKSDFELIHDPVPSYQRRTRIPRFLDPPALRLWRMLNSVPHQIVDSTANISGVWSDSDPHTFGNTMNGDARIYIHSHSHIEGEGYGPLHTGEEHPPAQEENRGNLPPLMPSELI